MKTTQLLIALAIFLSQYAYAQTPDFTNAFMTTWKTDAAGEDIFIPTKGGSSATDYDFRIDWGDGTPIKNSMGDDPNPSHTYTTAGTFTVEITGTFPHFYLNNNAEIRDKLLSVEQWGDIAWESMNNMFRGASNLTLNTTEMPALSGVTDMTSMFAGASTFNQDIGGWNVDNVRNMHGMFSGATSFNQDIGGWNVSSVTDMNDMFFSATAFNQDIGGWNVSSASSMNSMFFNATSFDQDIGGWNVSNVETMTSMFNNATSFNQDIGSWIVGSVTGMGSMFNQALAFNQDIGNWNVSNVETMTSMFFNATAFNQDIGNWNVSSVEDMTSMLSNATVFNQDISGWNVSGVTRMRFMFFGATVFDQDISGWDVSKVTKMSKMLDNSSLSTYHYEELLIAWNKLELQKDVVFGAAGKQYRARAKQAHDSLTSDTNHHWTINDGGLKNDPPVAVGFPDLVLLQGFSSHEIPIDSLFTDPEGDTLKLTFTTGGDMAITAALGEDNLTLTEIGIGVDSIIVTATDVVGAQATNTFYVSVDVPFDSAFTISWRTTAPGDSIGIPTTKPADDSNLSSAYDFYVDWGDGSPTQRIMGFEDEDSSHVYADADTYQIKITGTYPAFRLAGNLKAANLVSVDKWGNIAWESMQQAFFGANNLMIKAIDTPNLSGVTDMSRMFREATFSGEISHWNVSSVTNMDSMFLQATDFNQDIGDWNVSKVTNMSFMFYKASAFNQDIGRWSVDSVTDMSSMFDNATAFNQDISGWNVSHVTGMSEMFKSALVFDQDISGWNVSKVNTMREMFNNARAFNQDISGWNVSHVTNMSQMFSSARAFNQAIGSWNVSKVNTMSFMFSQATTFNQAIGSWNVSKVNTMRNMFSFATAFNQDIGGWNVSKVNNMREMFSFATAFNQDIGGWNVSKVTDMREMFSFAAAFNQDIGGWNVSKVTNMISMFSSASAFNQDIGEWNVSRVMNMSSMLDNSALSTYHYEQLLIAWNKLDLQKSVRFGAAGKQYRARAQEARDSLISDTNHNWSITDGDFTTENDTPTLTAPLPDLILLEGFGNSEVPIGVPFTDADEDLLTLSIAISGDMAVEATLGEGSLTLTEIGTGVDSIIMIATDVVDAQATDTFLVTVASFKDGFMTTWITAAANEVITIPTKGGDETSDYDFWIDWGDMTPPENYKEDDPNPSHTYTTADTFTVKITGIFSHFYLNNRTMIKGKLLSVEQWGKIAWESMANMFDGASNLTLNTTDMPDLSNVTDMSAMFSEATFSGDITGWNVSQVTDMNFMFAGATSFDQDIGDWNVSMVTNMNSMFYDIDSFNQDIGRWNVSSVQSMGSMFRESTSFNQNLNDWNVSKVANMSFMFAGATAFNGDISDWNVSKVTDMLSMFEESTSFNQDISDWNVSMVFDMESMLTGSGLSTYHYEELLIGWNKLNLLKTVILDAKDKQYRERARAAHDSLTSMTNHIWEINDAGLKAENDTPVVVGISDINLLQGFANHYIPIDSLFTDPDGDSLTLSIIAGGDMAIDATFGNDTLTLVETGTGVTMVYLTVNDIINEEVQVMDTFLVTVGENDPPRVANPLPDLTLDNGFGTHDIAISNTFEDVQPLMFSFNVASAEVLTAVLSEDMLTLTEVGAGTTRIIVTASDGTLQTRDTFLVTVKENTPPRVANPLADLVLNNRFEIHDIDISNTFEDVQPLMFSFDVDPMGVLTAELNGKSTLTLTEVGAGATRVIVTASDGELQTRDTFLVTVKEHTPVRIVNPLADLTLNSGFGTHDIDISNTFKDEHSLMFSVSVASAEVLTAVLSGDMLTLTEVGAGATRVIVTASDGALQIMDTFLVTVKENSPPRIVNPLADLTLNNGFGTHDLDISNTFEDKQPLMFSVSVDPAGVLTAVLSGDTLTLTEVDTGSTRVIVTANDGTLQTMDTFLVTIKNVSPRVANSLADLTLNSGFGTHDLDISNTFEDEQSLMFSVNVASTGVLTAVVNENTLTLTEVGTGETNVMVTARDGTLQIMDTFLVTVNKDPDIITAVEGEKELVTLYPNPTEGTISLDLGSAGKALMKFYTLQGNIIFEKTLSENAYNLELPGGAGIYLIEIITIDNRQIIKLVRE